MPRHSFQIYAIVRVDDIRATDLDPKLWIKVKEVVRTLEQACAEVDRLNALNSSKGCRYFWQNTRLADRHGTPQHLAVGGSSDLVGDTRNRVAVREWHRRDPIELSERAAVEVDLDMSDGTRRWCFFMTPGALSAVGDLVPGTSVRMHWGAPHMIVVSELSDAVIESTIRHLQAVGEIRACSLAFDHKAV